MPSPVSLVIAMFNMPRIPGNNLNVNTPNVNFPNMPSVDGPTFQAPTFQAPTIDSNGIQGPYMQGPQVNGPYYNGPQVPGQSYSGTSYSPSSSSVPVNSALRNESEGKYAPFWLGVLIFVWALAVAALVLLGLSLTGVNVNPFHFQVYHSQNAMTAFTTAGVEVSHPVPFNSTGGFGSGQVPFTYVDGYNFTVPTSGTTATGGILSFSTSSEMDAAKAWLTDPAKNGAISYRVYTKDNILIYLNVASETKADEYNKALQKMKL